MSHIPQRKEKDCLNCGTVVQGKYCQSCGQENVVPKETFWHMVTHFFYDIVHFDSKFFETLKDLLFKPGFLTKEYMQGRRASYLHPIKMYVFTSAIFFLLFFSFFSPNVKLIQVGGKMTTQERMNEITEIEEGLLGDTTIIDSIRKQKLATLQEMKDTTKPVTREEIRQVGDGMVNINFSGDLEKYKTVDEYDSIQRSLPKKERDGWFKKRLIKKELNINEKYRYNPEAILEKLSDTVLHRLPYLLFVSLPLFALILQLLYIRRKQFYYVDHGIFTIHLYIFTFILLLIVFCLEKLNDWTGLGIFNWVIGILFIALLFYLYKGMRNFYGQGRVKTFFKFLLTALISLIMVLVLLMIFFFLSAYEL